MKKPNLKQYKKDLVYLLIILNLVIWSVATFKAKSFYNSYTALLEQSLTKHQVSSANASTGQTEAKKYPSTREYVKQEIEKAGLDWEEVDCLIKNESGWNEWAQGVNNDKSTDSGLWQINSLHKGTIKLQDRFDVVKSTRWAIEKRLHDGNWNSWYGWKHNCQ